MSHIKQNSLTLRHENWFLVQLKRLISVSQNITHEGIVVAVDGQNVTVQFVRNSACSECHAKSLCSGGTSEAESRTVVANSYGVPYQVGEQVRVLVASGWAWQAVVVAFVVPVVLVLICLFLVVGKTGNEMLGCFAALILLAFYYFIFWLNRKHIDKKVEFLLERSTEN